MIFAESISFASFQDQDSSNSPPRTSLACTSKADPVEDGASSGQCEAQVGSTRISNFFEKFLKRK